MNAALLDGKSPGANGTVSETGWSNHSVFRQYITDHLLKFIPGRESHNVLLIMDGHKSHVSVGLCEWAKENGIIFFFLPPHTSHLLQPLDVACYGPFERMFSSDCHKLMRKTESVITRFNICEIACRVYSKALSPENAQSAFTCTGMHPLDRTAISSESHIPAEVYQDDSPDNEVEDVASQDSVNDGNQDQVENQDYILQMFSSKEAHLKKVKSEKVTKPRRTMSKIVSGKEIIGDILEKKMVTFLKK